MKIFFHRENGVCVFATNSADGWLSTLFVVNRFTVCTICRILSPPFVVNRMIISTICRNYLHHLSYFISTICRKLSIPFVVNISTICRKIRLYIIGY